MYCLCGIALSIIYGARFTIHTPCRATVITLPKTRHNLFYFRIKSNAQNNTLTPKTNECLLYHENEVMFRSDNY